MSLKDKFYAVKGQLRAEEYPLPSTNGHVDTLYVREIGSDEWLDIKVRSFRHRQANNGEPDLLYDARVVAHSVTDKDKNIVWDPHDDEELTRLSKEPARTFDPLLAAVHRVNASNDEQHEQLKKTSDSAPNSTSSTGSPATPAA